MASNSRRNEIFNFNDVINSNDLRKRIVNSEIQIPWTPPPTSNTPLSIPIRTPSESALLPWKSQIPGMNSTQPPITIPIFHYRPMISAIIIARIPSESQMGTILQPNLSRRSRPNSPVNFKHPMASS
jgi:hypothetical protein